MGDPVADDPDDPDLIADDRDRPSASSRHPTPSEEVVERLGPPFEAERVEAVARLGLADPQGQLQDIEVDRLVANVLEVELPERAWVLLCSDGLWNYAEAARELAELAASAPEAESALEACRRLVAFANAGGGHDNISAVLLRLST